MNLYIHQILKERNKKYNWVYISSILMINKNVPLFEEHFGQLDFDWLLKVTKNRRCKEIDACVIRYVGKTNLSLNKEYRKNEFYISMLEVDDNLHTLKTMYGSRARYYYLIGEMKRARFHFLRANINWKTILYIITSYSKVISKLIIKKFGVFG